MSTATVINRAGLLVVEPAAIEAEIVNDQRAIEKAQAQPTKEPAALDIAHSYQITSEIEYIEAEGQAVRWKLAIQAAHESYDPVCASAHDTHKKACNARASVIDPLEQACKVLGQKLSGYLVAEQKRLMDEERQRQEEARRLALEAREAEIEQAEADGAEPEEVQAICEMPLPPVAVVAPARRPVGNGAATLRQTFKGTIESPLQALRYIVEHHQFLNLVSIDEQGLNRLANALKTTNSPIPGIKFYVESGATIRTAGKGGR